MSPDPLLHVIFDALVERGWSITASVTHGSVFVDPEGNRHASIEGAILAQTAREIAGAYPPPEEAG